MNSYENAPATKLLATNCACCGRPLVDSISVSLGIGPECRKEYDGGITEEVRVKANKLIHEAAVSAGLFRASEVMAKADEIEALGLSVLADKIRRRFKNAEKKADIIIEETTGRDGEWYYRITTPFRRGDADRFVAAWRTVPGRRWDNGANVVPFTSKKALWNVLCNFFGGHYAKGPKGVFRVPNAEPTPVQSQLELS